MNLFVVSWIPPSFDTAPVFPTASKHKRPNSEFIQIDTFFYTWFNYSDLGTELPIHVKHQNDDFELFYHPFVQTRNPYTADSQQTAEGWLCWNKSECVVIANHETVFPRVSTTPLADYISAKRNPIWYQVPAYGNVSLRIILIPDMQYTSPKWDSELFYNEGIFNITCRWAGSLPNNAREPPTSQLVPHDIPDPRPDAYYAYFDRSENSILEFSLLQFEPTSRDLLSQQLYSFWPVTLYIQLGGLISPPPGYTAYGNEEQASIWKCYTKLFGEKVCYDYGDYRFDVQIAPTFLIYKGGSYADKEVRINTRCNKSVPQKQIHLLHQLAETHEGMTFSVESSAFCDQAVEQPQVNRMSTTGAFIVLGFWALFTLVVALGLLVNYLWKSLLVFPLTDMWSILGQDVVAGWNTLTCSTGSPPPVKQSNGAGYAMV